MKSLIYREMEESPLDDDLGSFGHKLDLKTKEAELGLITVKLFAL